MPRPKGSGIPAKGAGWGGPAKGASTSRIKPGDPDGIRPLRWDADNIAAKEEVAAQMRGVLHQVALAGENEHARIAAAGRLLDHIEDRKTKITATAGNGVVRVEIIDAGSPDTALSGAAAIPPAGDNP
jgi:hypothetical protein